MKCKAHHILLPLALLLCILSHNIQCHANAQLFTKPKDTTPQHKSINTQKKPIKSIPASNKKTPRAAWPFHPFSFVGAPAGPALRPDFTTKSREPIDTLQVLDVPQDNYHSLPPSLGGHKFISIDTHLATILPRHQPSPSPEYLGGLSPDEVFYADKDLLVLKGGGFKGVSHHPPHKSPQQTIDSQEDDLSIPSHPSPQNSIRAPNPHENYNGNIPTFAAPPPFNALRIPPTPAHNAPLALFLPANFLTSPATQSHFYLPHNRFRPYSPSWYYHPKPPFHYQPVSVIPPAPPRSHSHPYAQYSLPTLHHSPNSLLTPHYIGNDIRVNFQPNLKRNPDAEWIPGFHRGSGGRGGQRGGRFPREHATSLHKIPGHLRTSPKWATKMHSKNTHSPSPISRTLRQPNSNLARDRKIIKNTKH